jgi:1,4-dihydroxy-2-naphthoate octaprenyltransferase
MAKASMTELPPDDRPAPPPPRRGISLERARPIFFVAGAAYIVGGVVKFIVHQPEGWLFIGCGIAFIAFGFLFTMGRGKMGG